MAKAKSSKATKKKNQKYDPGYILRHPSTWIAAILALALLVVYGLSMYALQNVKPMTKLESSEVAVFDHLAKSYIREMEFTTDFDKPTIKHATGYGVSDEDNVLYITFDFAAVPENTHYSFDELEVRHGIIYFKWDAERKTYGHAYSYHDDADYHPDGTYVKF